MEFKQLLEKQPTLIWSITDMITIEDILQKVELQALDSQSLAQKTLTNLFLEPEFDGDINLMRFHLQQLQINQQILRDLMDLKLHL